MSFSVWKQVPPFTFKAEDVEQIYKVGSVWVVTDDPARATQAEVDALNAQVAAESAPKTVAQKLAAIGLTVADIKTELAK